MREAIHTEEADRLLAQAGFSLSTEQVPLREAGGRVLAASISADRDIPPYDRVTMDGVALASATVTAGQRSLRVAGTILAGQPRTRLQDPRSCLRIMTGAVLPEGADCVVPVEQLKMAEGTATLMPGADLEAGRNVHPRGSDVPAGRTVLAAGARLGPRHIGVLASVGQADVTVSCLPRVAVMSTGDEVVPVAGPVAPHQVRQSNLAVVCGFLRELGIEPLAADHLPDDRQQLHRHLKRVAGDCDVLITCGAVSRGDTDVLPALLVEAGYDGIFHRVLQRPGKPLWFGARRDRPGLAFGLPGNPVSVLVCLRRYVAMALAGLQGAPPPPTWRGRLTREVSFRAGLTWFLPVALAWEQGFLQATPRPVGTSGDYVGVAGSDGLMQLPADQDTFAEGQVAPVLPWSLTA